MGAATDLREGAEAIALDAGTIWPDPTPNLASALVAALADLTVVEKGRTAKIPTKDGKSYSYDFADIADVVKLTRPALSAHGIVALTPIHAHDGGLACTVRLVHTSGETMDLGPFPFPRGHDAQSTGSAVTYHRRYALVAALGIAAGDDDDGAAAKPRAAASAGPSQEAIDAAETLDDLPAEVAEEITGRLEVKAGVRLLDALEYPDWRNWLSGAVKHAAEKLKGGES